MERLHVYAEVVKLVFNETADRMAEELGGCVSIGPEGYKYILDVALKMAERTVFERVKK